MATIQTDFQDNNATSAATYADVMKSGDFSKVFGTSYGSVTVDPKSVQTGQVSNPARKPLHLTALLQESSKRNDVPILSTSQNNPFPNSTSKLNCWRAGVHDTTCWC